MSVTAKSAIFLAITFAVSWSICAAGHFSGAANNPLIAVATLAAMMFGPAIAALICAFAFERGRVKEALGLRFMPNLWWLFAWAIALAYCALALGATLLFGHRTLIDLGARLAEQIAHAPHATTAPVIPPQALALITIVSAVLIGPWMNAPILTFSEELGWRGYLYDLWRPSGFWKSSLATGFVWGVWHAPAILWFGLNYPANRAIGVPIFVLFCMLLAPIMAFARERGRSVIVSGILHGTINAAAGVTIITLNDPSFPWSGAVGIGGFIALALMVAAIAFVHRPVEH